MNILFVLENYYPNVGGVETLFKTLLEELADRGHTITLVTTRLTEESPFKEELGNLTIYRYPFANRYIFTFFALFPIMRHAGKADLVHTTSYNAGLPAFFAAKFLGKKCIITFHEVWGKLWFRLPYMSSFSRFLHYSFEQFLLKLPFNRFIGVSESTAEALEQAGVAKKRILVNYNGLNYDALNYDALDYDDLNSTSLPTRKVFKEESPEKKDIFVYTYCGRLGISKGMDVLFEAAATFAQNHPDSQLKMIIPKTPKPLYKTILEEIKKRKLQYHITFKHELTKSELKAELQESDCVVVPSYSEGFCFVAVECIAMGIPLISSDQTALREVVSGTFLKMKEHTPEALVEALEKAKRGEWEKTPIKRFDLKDTVERYIGIYEDLLDS